MNVALRHHPRMDALASRTGLARWLASPDPVEGPEQLAARWHDAEVTLVLAPVVPLDAGFGAHLRRSFLGALAPGASDAARAGQPCPWDPPCALDLFLREQLRSGGDGLPKPYVLFWEQEGPALAVTLRVFGTACDWFPAAAEALAAGLTGILPWDRALPGQTRPPQILTRHMMPTAAVAAPHPGPVTLRLLSPLDDEGAQPGRDIAAAMLSRAIRRVDAVARWHGLALEEDCTRGLTAAAHALTAAAVRLQRTRRDSPNRQGQARTTRVQTGEIDLPPLPEGLAWILALAERCHIGRHTNEGLGRVAVVLRDVSARV